MIAFYPCIYFCDASQLAFNFAHQNYRRLSNDEKINKILERERNRSEFYVRLIKLVAISLRKGFRMIIENPWNGTTYLKANFLKSPDLVDENRLLRGDYFKKPTAYWYWNCEPTYGESFQYDKNPKRVQDAKQGSTAGICSEERSMISSDYARNFICDFIIGKNQGGQINLFDEEESGTNDQQ